MEALFCDLILNVSENVHRESENTSSYTEIRHGTIATTSKRPVPELGSAAFRLTFSTTVLCAPFRSIIQSVLFFMLFLYDGGPKFS